MSESRKAHRPVPPAPRRTRRPFPILAGLAVIAGLPAVGAWWWNHSSETGRLAAFQKLEGRGQRDDDGYIIDIRRVDGGGKPRAAYRNPRPINVARAEASMEADLLEVFVELRAVSYPGSTCQLTCDRANGSLKGSYVQAAPRETCDVVFVRLKPGLKSL